MKRLLWTIPQAVALGLLLVSVYANAVGAWRYGLLFTVLGLLLLGLSIGVYEELT